MIFFKELNIGNILNTCVHICVILVIISVNAACTPAKRFEKTVTRENK